MDTDMDANTNTPSPLQKSTSVPNAPRKPSKRARKVVPRKLNFINDETPTPPPKRQAPVYVSPTP